MSLAALSPCDARAERCVTLIKGRSRQALKEKATLILKDAVLYVFPSLTDKTDLIYPLPGIKCSVSSEPAGKLGGERKEYSVTIAFN